MGIREQGQHRLVTRESVMDNQSTSNVDHLPTGELRPNHADGPKKVKFVDMKKREWAKKSICQYSQ